MEKENCLIEWLLEGTIYVTQVNPNMTSQLEDAGLSFVGKDETGHRMEVIVTWSMTNQTVPCRNNRYGDNSNTPFFSFYKIYGFCDLSVIYWCILLWQIVELPDHPYFVGVQFHPEFKSRPGKPSALFLGIFLFCWWIPFDFMVY